MQLNHISLMFVRSIKCFFWIDFGH